LARAVALGPIIQKKCRSIAQHRRAGDGQAGLLRVHSLLVVERIALLLTISGEAVNGARRYTLARWARKSQRSIRHNYGSARTQPAIFFQRRRVVITRVTATPDDSGFIAFGVDDSSSHGNDRALYCGMFTQPAVAMYAMLPLPILGRCVFSDQDAEDVRPAVDVLVRSHASRGDACRRARR